MVSTSAEEKPEEKLRTKSLQDEEPQIDEWKDQDESEQQQEESKEEGEPPISDEQQSESDADSSQQSSNNSQGPESVETSPEEDLDNQTQSESERISVQKSEESDNGENLGSESQGQEQPLGGGGSEEEEESVSDDVFQLKGNEENGIDSQSNGSTNDGSTEAENDHVSGTRYGTKDVRMTAQELETTKRTRDDLQGYLEQLKKMQ